MNDQQLSNDEWCHPIFDNAKRIVEDEYDFVCKPFVVIEGSEAGFSTCVKCKSTRTFTVGRQDRSCDEPTSVFVTCLECGATSRTNA